METEKQKIKDFITQIKISIPVNISRISDQVNLDSNRSVHLIKTLLNDNSIKGSLYESEGVFIKEGATTKFSGGSVGVPFYCQIDGETHPGTDVAFQCAKCARFVCEPCFHKLIETQRSLFPMCDGRLQKL